jgi:hypothetical protein
MSNWANRTKAALTTVDTSALKPVGQGNFEPVSQYIRFTTPKTPHPKVRVLGVNEKIEGVYEGTSTFRNKFDETKQDVNHKLRLADGTLVSIGGVGQLNYRFKSINEGSNVAITYLGKNMCEKGKMKGKKLHEFIVLADNQKA